MDLSKMWESYRTALSILDNINSNLDISLVSTSPSQSSKRQRLPLAHEGSPNQPISSKPLLGSEDVEHGYVHIDETEKRSSLSGRSVENLVDNSAVFDRTYAGGGVIRTDALVELLMTRVMTKIKEALKPVIKILVQVEMEEPIKPVADILAKENDAIKGMRVEMNQLREVNNSLESQRFDFNTNFGQMSERELK